MLSHCRFRDFICKDQNDEANARLPRCFRNLVVDVCNSGLRQLLKPVVLCDQYHAMLPSGRRAFGVAVTETFQQGHQSLHFDTMCTKSSNHAPTTACGARSPAVALEPV
eukprot:6301993-Amphidinium_carterae.1